MNFWLEFSSFLILFYIHLRIFILCKNFRRLFSGLSYSFFTIPFFSFCVIGLQDSRNTSVFLSAPHESFLGRGRERGICWVGATFFFFSFFLLHHV